MNKIFSLFVKPTLQTCAIRSSQWGNITRIALCSTEAPKKLPPSKNPKHKTSPMVTLISQGDKVEVTTLDQAKKIAERRSMKLVSIVDFDTKTSRQVFKYAAGKLVQ